MRDSGRAPRPFQINKPRVASERGVQPSCGGNKIQGPKTGGTEQRVPNWSKAWSGRSRLRLRTGATVLRNSGLLIKSKLSPSPSKKVGGRDIFARSAMIAASCNRRAQGTHQTTLMLKVNLLNANHGERPSRLFVPLIVAHLFVHPQRRVMN